MNDSFVIRSQLRGSIIFARTLPMSDSIPYVLYLDLELLDTKSSTHHIVFAVRSLCVFRRTSLAIVINMHVVNVITTLFFLYIPSLTMAFDYRVSRAHHRSLMP